MSNNKVQKTFWERPEGTPGMLILAAAIAASGYGLYVGLPYIITLLQNLWTALALGGSLAVVLALASDRKVRNLVWYFYKSFVRKLTGAFVTIDPIGILNIYVEDLVKKSHTMAQRIQELKGQVGKLKNQIARNREDLNNNLALASKAREMGKDQMEITLYSNKAARIKGSNAKLEKLLATMDMLSKMIVKMKKASDFMIEDTKDKVKHMEEEHEYIKSSHSVMKSAKAIIAGDNDKKMLFDQAMEHVVDDIGFKLGEMESFMDDSQAWLSNVDIQNAVFEEKGLGMLEEWDNKIAKTFLLEEGKDFQVLNNLNTKKAEPVKLNSTKSVNNGGNSKYSSFM